MRDNVIDKCEKLNEERYNGFQSFHKKIGTLKIKSKYPVITLCGSTKFKDKFIEIQGKLTLAGNIVISVGLFGHSGDDVVGSEGVKEMLDDMHKAKIDLADSIFVINVGGYIGESTRKEIEYAKMKNKNVLYLEGTHEED